MSSVNGPTGRQSRARKSPPPDIFRALPRELGALIKPELPSLTEEIVRQVRDTVSAYAPARDRSHGPMIRLGVRQALDQFAEQIANPAKPRDEGAEIYRRIGRLEARQGRSLDSLDAALRVGAKVALRRIGQLAHRTRFPPQTLFLLGDAVLAHIDALAALAVEGHAAAQADSPQQLRRGQLFELLVANFPTAQENLVDLARRAGWPLPPRICVVALAPPADHEQAAIPRLPDRFLANTNRSCPCLLVPDPHERLWWDELAEPLHGWQALIGPTVPLSEAGKSLRMALDLSDLVHSGCVRGDPVVWCADHVVTLWLLRDEFLACQVIANGLAPLLPLTRARQQRLRETLMAWLETRGGAPTVAARLNVHPQTVRYRMRQLTRLFGDRLTDPDSKFAIELALRAAACLRQEE